MDPLPSASGCLPGTLCHFLAFTASPVLGNLCAVALFLAPLPQVLRVRASGRLDGLNVLPYPLIVGNCLAWFLYGCFLRDTFLILPNAIGFCAGLFYILSTFPITPAAGRARGTVLLVAACAWCFLGAELGFVVYGHPDGRSVMGWFGTVVLLAFFASPLSSLLEVLQKRDSTSIHVPLAVAGVFNGGFWTVYGLVLSDPFVYMPNAFGLLSAFAQLGLAQAFPRRPVGAQVVRGGSPGGEPEGEEGRGKEREREVLV
ncbi:sugar efflux transporter for intercellular exchange-domain-containing protein [Hyaloraphidium curvatum]|nr:sugar efflux transporter for intercellular exchange-domain-containing protein [Hyaloraphidium curvatum]